MSYIFSTITLSVMFASLFKIGTVVNNKIQARLLMFLICCVTLWRVTFREVSGDTLYYVMRFKDMFSISLKGALQLYNDDRLFLILTWFASRISHSQEVFLFLVGALFLALLYSFLKSLFSTNQMLFVLTSYSLYPFFYYYASNTIRQGISIGFILCALSFYLKDDKSWRKSLVLLISASLFHWSAIPIAALLLFLKKFDLSLKASILIWYIGAVIYLLKLQMVIVSPLLNYIPRIDFYGRTRDGINLTGNRLDFFVFSLAFVIVGLLLLKFVYHEKQYLRMVKAYILFNTVFLIMGFIAYSDRIAAYSWFLIPAMVWLPVLKTNKRNVTYSAILMMFFIAVGLISGVFKF